MCTRSSGVSEDRCAARVLIVERIAAREGFTPEMARRVAVGLKLMGEVMLENRDNPLFNQLSRISW